LIKAETPFSGGRIAGIDPLRGAAALAVVACHIGGHFWGFTRDSPGPEKLFGWLGQWGVALFFVISGFCIRLPMARARQVDPAARLDVAAFARHRLLRIAPPYWAAVAASVAAGLLMPTELLDGAHGPLDVTLHLLGLHTLWPDTFASINGVFWTIGIEAHFYAAYLLVANRRLGAAMVAVLLVLALSAFGAASMTLAGGWRTVGQALFVTTFWQWGLGAMLADWRTRVSPRMDGTLLWFSRGAVIAVSLAMGLVDPRVAGLHLMPWLLPFAAAGIVALFVIQPRTEGGRRAKGLDLFAWLGRVSYSLYLLHPVMLSVVAFAIAGGWLARGLGPAAELLGSLALAWVAYGTLERPTLRWRARLQSTVNRSHGPTPPA